MDPVTIGMTILGQAGKYLLDNGGKDVVKKASDELFNWVKGKFTKPEQQEKVEILKADPENEEAQEQFKKLLSGSLEFDIIDQEELKEKMKDFEKVIVQEDPEWLSNAGVEIKNNSIVVKGDHNIGGVQDIHQSTITIKKG